MSGEENHGQLGSILSFVFVFVVCYLRRVMTYVCFNLYNS